METLSIDIHNFSKVLFKFGSETECFLVFFCSKSGVKAPEYDDWRVYSLRMLQQHWHLPWNAWGCSPNIMALDKKKKEKTSLGTSSITSLSPLSLSRSLCPYLSLSYSSHFDFEQYLCYVFITFLLSSPCTYSASFSLFLCPYEKVPYLFPNYHWCFISLSILFPLSSSLLSSLCHWVVILTCNSFPPSLSLSLSLSFSLSSSFIN